MGKYQSGQMGQTVNLLAYAFGGSNPSLPTPIKKNVSSSTAAHFFLLSPPLFRAEHKIAGDGLSSVLADEVLAEHLYAVGRGRLRDENDGESLPVSTPTVLFVGWKCLVVLAE